MRPASPFERFIHVPGPNPILVRGEQGAWDEACIECCDVLKEQETYYLYYHGYPLDREKFPRACYRLGVATAPHPLGPWTRHPDNPVLDLGPEGSWDGQGVACASILKEGADRFHLFYSGRGERWSIGLATGPSPVGPWTKFEGNPVMEDFGYVGGVFTHEGKYWLYTEHPIGATGPDYGPISLAHAERPEGPWTAYEGNPVLAPGSDHLQWHGEWGTWDDGGYSEAEVTLRDGVFHIFYGAARLHPTRILSQESIGYAYSYDGLTFTKFAGNPVAMRERDPGAAAFAEVHHLFEPPLIYVYHTLRYVASDPASIEDLGVQVLATQSPFCIPMPVLSLDRLGPAECSSLDACPTLSLEHIRRCALTLDCKFGSAAGAGLRLHVRSSPDGLRYDTADLAAFDLAQQARTVCRQTFDLDCGARFVKLMVENLDADQPVTDVSLTATLKG
jgi:hypothetical protein